MYAPDASTFHPYVFMFGTPPLFHESTLTECDYLNNEKVFNFMNLNGGSNVYDISIQMARERGAMHLGNKVILNGENQDVKRYWPTDDSFDVGSADCDINLMKTRTKKSLLVHFADVYAKRIMQLDEEVGKLSQPSPFVVSKAVEIFIDKMVKLACKCAKEQKEKKVKLGHLEQICRENSQFEFLVPIVEEAIANKNKS